MANVSLEPMPVSHLFIALFVVAIWAFNFVAIKVALVDFPPILMAAIRFALAAVPFVFFIRRPAAPFRLVAFYGLLVFALQFGLVFLGMALGVSASLAAIGLQLTVFVTIGLAAIIHGERVSRVQLAGAAVAVAGLAIIAANAGGDVSLPGFVCVLLGACCWGAGNLVGKAMGKVDMVALVVWSSLVAPLPLAALSLLVEGPDRIGHALSGVSWPAAASMAYIVYASTHIGYSAWAWLMARHPASTVAPFSLLVPPLAAVFSAAVLGESFPAWKLVAGSLVLAGVLINLFGGRIVASLRPARSA
ncbi:MAG: EamA family transporter [Ramlibacter sp.]|nr:EamA family transporter [Ramlibacter sp.]